MDRTENKLSFVNSLKRHQQKRHSNVNRRSFYKRAVLILGLIVLNLGSLHAQEKTKSTEINYISERTSKDESKYPEALLMYKVNNQVIFTHEGVKVWCDQAIFYEKDNFFRASGNVRIQQGDSITLTSDYAEYDGNTQFAFASNDVYLETEETNLTTDSLFFNRQKQEAFYRTGGVIRDTSSTITSTVGHYYIEQKKYSFTDNVVVTNENYVIHSDHIDYYPETGKAYLYGPSTITSEENKLYCERGFYNTQKDYGYFVKKANIDYEYRNLKGDSIYFDRNRGFASATNNIIVTDTSNQSVAKGHYAEVYRDRDSVFITKRALISKRQEKDSIHIHSDTIMVTGKPDHRVIRAFYKAKIFKEDFNGKADSIVSIQDEGLTKMLGRPVVFSGLTQLTGDTIELYNNTQTNQLDSLSVFDNAFLIQKDSIDGFNQIKGKIMYGLFKENNELDEANFIKNTETIYYWRDDKTADLIGINKAVSSSIKVVFENNDIRSIEYAEDPENITHQPKDFPENARKLRGFLWRGDERICSKAALFTDDEPFTLPKIRGIPLPEKDAFFNEENKTDLPLLNEKSRLSPEVLKEQN